MEEDSVAALYGTLGLSAGGELSSQDVSFLFDKVFHLSSNTDDAHAAMKKISGGDKSWSCSGQNVLDVLIEMERERERKEMLYWNFQLLNAGNLPHLMDCSHPTDADIFKNTPNSDSGSLRPHRTETAFFQTGGLLGEKKLGHIETNVRRLKKAAGHCWALLASLGMRGLLPSPWQTPRSGIQSQAWGCISLSDILLLVEVKYDAVAHLLYREMLQEHHTERVWERLSPWQQLQEVEVLEDLAEEALESVDLLGLAVLPGAFRMYKMCPGSDLMNQSWSAVSLLNDLNAFRQQEQTTLTALGDRLCGESLRLLCLYIRLATYRAQREKMSHSALLAARQSWDSWPQVVSPCRAEQVALWFHGREEEEDQVIETPQQVLDNMDVLSVTKENLWQQTELQLLVWTQEQERKHLLTVLHGISAEDLQAPDSEQTSLRAGCLRRLRQIHAQLQKQSGSPSKHRNFQTLTQRERSQVLLEDCAMILLTRLIELQEVQASYLLQELLDRNTQGVQVLRRKYESELEARFTSLLHLLIADEPPTPGFVAENTRSDLTGPESSSPGETVSGGSAAATTDRTSCEQKEVQTADGSSKQDICSGCGAVMEDLPYLEILCGPNPRGDALESLDAGRGTCKEDEASVTESHQSSEKQRSLITLAWSKPSEDGQAETTDGETEQNQDDGTKTQVQSTQHEETVLETVVNHTLLQNGSSDQYSATEQLNLKKKPRTDRSDEGEVASESNLQTDATEAENLQRLQPNVSDDSLENTDDLFSAAFHHTASATRGKEICPTESTLGDLREPEHSGYEDRTRSQESTMEFSLSEGNRTREPSLMEKERVRHPVSAMDRARTMQNLVDMQRKFEEKHQRDKERQLLRVQERLSIIQNRKAEEDLLGLKHTDRMRHLTQDLPMEDKNQQKTVVKERLEQLRRERSYIMQSKRDRNTAVFKELLAPVHLHISETEDGTETL